MIRQRLFDGSQSFDDGHHLVDRVDTAPRRARMRRPAQDLHLELDAPAWEEHGWEGGTLDFAGGVRLALLHPCERCVIPTIDPATRTKWPTLLRHLAARHETLFGINARVLEGGVIAAGERVAVRASG